MPRWKNSILLGNDLVWLDDPANRGRHADLLLVRRVLTPTERLLVQVSQEPDRRLWSLWAAKEAAYKALRRQDPALVFSPARFAVEPAIAEGHAVVVHDERRLNVVWAQGPDWVHALAWTGTIKPVFFVEKCPSGTTESVAVRELASRELVRAGYGPGTVEDRPPVYREDSGREFPVSLSHDGPYTATAFFSPSY